MTTVEKDAKQYVRTYVFAIVWSLLHRKRESEITQAQLDHGMKHIVTGVQRCDAKFGRETGTWEKDLDRIKQLYRHWTTPGSAIYKAPFCFTRSDEFFQPPLDQTKLHDMTRCHACRVKQSDKTIVKFCGVCKQAVYCSRRCQKMHWKYEHRYVCSGRCK